MGNDFQNGAQADDLREKDFNNKKIFSFRILFLGVLLVLLPWILNWSGVFTPSDMYKLIPKRVLNTTFTISLGVFILNLLIKRFVFLFIGIKASVDIFNANQQISRKRGIPTKEKSWRGVKKIWKVVFLLSGMAAVWSGFYSV